MRVLEVLPVLRKWHSEGYRAAVATLVEVRRSAPRDPGAALVVREDGEMHGSVSGGCVEAALAYEGQAVLQSRRARILEYGITDAQMQAAGLSCGGTIAVFVDEPHPDLLRDLEHALETQSLVATALRLDEARPARMAVFDGVCVGTLGERELDEAVASETRSGTLAQSAQIRTYGTCGEPHGDVRIFIERVLSKPRMYIFGAIDFAAAMVRVAKLMGYEVTVCDARPAFAKPERFPEADRVVAAWPDDFLRETPVDERTAIVSLTHDEKFDIPLIRAALQTSAGYIGVMGSRRTNETRIAQLREAGVGFDELARLSAPIGLDLGARTPEEVAISIAAEIIAHRYDRDGGRLTGKTGTLRGRP